MGTLANKTAVITGGASGIGRAAAERFEAEGATVMVADVRNEEPGEEIVRCDVTIAAEVQRLAAHALKRLGHVEFSSRTLDS